MPNAQKHKFILATILPWLFVSVFASEVHIASIQKEVFDLAKSDKVITYDYHRLASVSYPDHPENNVRYAKRRRLL